MKDERGKGAERKTEMFAEAKKILRENGFPLSVDEAAKVITILNPYPNDQSDMLSKFTNDERGLLNETLDKAADAALMIVRGDITKAMNIYN